jgi:catechol 2,3-dioxygenase-like lactoylglutathione lyase family enzyme
VEESIGSRTMLPRTEVTGMFTPLGLDHVVLRVRDQAVSEKFYREVLGCTVERVNDKLSLIQLRFGEHLIDLLPAAGDLPAREGRGIDHFCVSIRCDDLEALAGALSARGVRLESGVVPRYGAYGAGPSLYIRDPDDYTIELKPRR